jgi:predicted RNA binding protein YcfA (HicA-like mRNA interferase family)
MMSKRKKRLDRIRQNPNNVSLEDLRLVLEDYGFEYKQTVGSHYTYTVNIGGQRKLFVVPYRRPVKPIYVRRALKLIDQIIEEQSEDDNSDEA